MDGVEADVSPEAFNSLYDMGDSVALRRVGEGKVEKVDGEGGITGGIVASSPSSIECSGMLGSVSSEGCLHHPCSIRNIFSLIL